MAIGGFPRLEANGERTTLAGSYRSNRLNSPNDACIQTVVVFTDPPYGLAGLENDPARELDYNGIYRLSPEGEIQLLERNQTRPNGIVFLRMTDAVRINQTRRIKFGMHILLFTES